MRTVEIARRLAELGKTPEAQRAYEVSIHENNHTDNLIDFEAATFLLLTGGNVKIAFETLAHLYNDGFATTEIYDLLVKHFYIHKAEKLRKRYAVNLKKLAEYPYLFKKDFCEYDDLEIQFFPVTNKGYIPYYKKENRFGEYKDFSYPLIDRNFFADLDKPVFSENVYSQYQIEYLNDNVRKSEWVAKENHIYLYYTSFQEFLAHLQVLELGAVLAEKKVVFLFEEEKERYPIDFKECFDIDYSEYSVKPISVREVNKLIWHTQLATHNGGDFFNEIFDSHPNLIYTPSLIFSDVQKNVDVILQAWKQKNWNAVINMGKDSFAIMPYLKNIKHGITRKDAFVALCLTAIKQFGTIDESSRIAPALFFQPHFYHMVYGIRYDESDTAVLDAENCAPLFTEPFMYQFKYIKTFTPMRRISNSYAAEVKFVNNPVHQEKGALMTQLLTERLLNKSYMVDRQNRLFTDSRLVRFEDGKLNPKATFTALAAFLDLPYTQSMTYCSLFGEKNPESLAENTIGFDTSSVYRTNDEFAGDAERYIIECFSKEAYNRYGYNFHFYDNTEVDETILKNKVEQCELYYSWIKKSALEMLELNPSVISINSNGQIIKITTEMEEEEQSRKERLICTAEAYAEDVKHKLYEIVCILNKKLHFVNSAGYPLEYMQLLTLDESLLEQPLYH